MTRHLMESSTARRMIGLMLTALLMIAAAGCGTASPAAETTETSATAAPTEPTEPTEDSTAEVAPTDDQTTEPEQTGGEQPTEQDSEAVTDGSFPAYLTDVGENEVVVDKIEILSGEEAVAARAEDGEPPVEEGLDIPYLRNRNDKLRTIPVDPNVVVAVYDCSQACEHVEWSYRDLLAGTPLPYGSMDVPFMVTVSEGDVVEIAEVYLP